MVAIAVGRDGIDTLLVISQVVLSIVLPFITVPLLWCTSSQAVMSVKKTRSVNPPRESTTIVGTEVVQAEDKEKAFSSSSPLPSPRLPASQVDETAAERGEPKEETVDYSNNKLTIGLGIVIWLVIVAANVYALVELGINPSDA